MTIRFFMGKKEFFVRTIEDIKDEIETLQDCGDLDPCLRDHASERLMELWDELERVSDI